jgi:pyruvate dehydrogenase E2 component (dihydrolipoamide acetyltransferase)
MPDVLMPKLSDTMEEGRIIRWLKQRGDRIAIGDILAEVETDKANMELEAYDEGTLAEIRTPEGESAPVGAGSRCCRRRCGRGSAPPRRAGGGGAETRRRRHPR